MIIEIHIYIACIKSFFFVKNIKKKKKRKYKKHVQLKALPGQPVCKHSMSMCFGRAPAPRAHSKLQQGWPGCAQLLLPGRAPPGPASRPSLSGLASGSGVGAGAGRWQCRSVRCSAVRLVATHGFSWLLGGPWGGYPGGEPREVPEAAFWPGCLCPVSVELGPSGTAPPSSLLWSQRLVLLGFISRLFPLCG